MVHFYPWFNFFCFKFISVITIPKKKKRKENLNPIHKIERQLTHRRYTYTLLFGRRPNREIEIQSCNRHAIRANVNKPTQAERRECQPRERLVQGKNRAEKKALLAGYLIPLLRSQKLCNKETQFPTVWGGRN